MGDDSYLLFLASETPRNDKIAGHLNSQGGLNEYQIIETMLAKAVTGNRRQRKAHTGTTC
jgi:hypothetical protein